ncbi:Oxo-4-hydroxy-4-carboxy-5-ureidoimidazoline decarboxylase domain-containing protein [[Candida] zeylanoides]
MSFTLPSIESLPDLSQQAQIEVLDNLFEPCHTLQAFLLSGDIFRRSFSSYNEFIEQARSELLGLLARAKSSKYGQEYDPRVSEIIAAHPRLGAPKADQSQVQLSDHSSAEQKSMQGSEEEAAKLTELNELYEEKFPGLRYVVFVNGRSRASVMQNMMERIKRGDIGQERKDAFNAMCDIALDRSQKAVKQLVDDLVEKL